MVEASAIAINPPSNPLKQPQLIAPGWCGAAEQWRGAVVCVLEKAEPVAVMAWEAVFFGWVSRYYCLSD